MRQERLGRTWGLVTLGNIHLEKVQSITKISTANLLPRYRIQENTRINKEFGRAFEIITELTYRQDYRQDLTQTELYECEYLQSIECTHNQQL